MNINNIATFNTAVLKKYSHSPATVASLGIFLSSTSARFRRIPAESIAPTERRIPKKNSTPEGEDEGGEKNEGGRGRKRMSRRIKN